MYRALLVFLFLTPAALAERAWVGDIPGCTREAALEKKPLPYGCATALNLAAMINDTSDLVHPPAAAAQRAGDLADTVTSSRTGAKSRPPLGAGVGAAAMSGN